MTRLMQVGGGAGMRFSGGAAWPGLSVGRAAGSAPAYQRILALAADDGWAALYDPTNPETRTLRESGDDQFAAAIADGLASAPAMTQATEASQLALVEAGLGRLDALEGGSGRWLQQATAVNLTQPIHIVVVARATTGAVHRYAYDGDVDKFLLTYNSSDAYVSETSGGFVTGGTTDLNTHVVSCRFDGAASTIRVDGAQVAAGNTGTGGLDRLTWGVRKDKALPFQGLLGPLLVYDGALPDAARDRMEALLAGLMT